MQPFCFNHNGTLIEHRVCVEGEPGLPFCFALRKNCWLCMSYIFMSQIHPGLLLLFSMRILNTAFKPPSCIHPHIDYISKFMEGENKHSFMDPPAHKPETKSAKIIAECSRPQFSLQWWQKQSRNCSACLEDVCGEIEIFLLGIPSCLCNRVQSSGLCLGFY